MSTTDIQSRVEAIAAQYDIPKEKFKRVEREGRIHDERLQTKAIGYLGDAWIRFRKDKSAVVAFCLILLLALFAVIIPIFSSYTVNFRDPYYRNILPRAGLFQNAGFWDGGKRLTQNEAGYQYLNAIGQETGKPAVMKVYDEFTDAQGQKHYKLRVDTYYQIGFVYQNLSESEYLALQAYQNETGIQVIYPLAKTHNKNAESYINGNDGANFWYLLQDEGRNTDGAAVLDENGNYIPNYITSSNPKAANYDSLRIEGDGENGVWYTYAFPQGRQGNYYKVRVDYEEYFNYQNHFYPSFLFGTNVHGQDIFTCLAIAARFSLLLAITVASINFVLGMIYGSIAGYYGGWVDMIMERISDILASVPFIVVATLFQLHLADKVGPVVSLLFAYILKGWVGTAATVRTQFYRFKGHEYVLAARTLGASDKRLIFKHIFPNSLGTIVTGAVMTIPGVIFSESMLSYLHIINLDTHRTLTSIGTMLSQGQAQLQTFPHEILFPAIFIAILEISFNLFGNGLRDALNPSLRGADS
ncbi:MAG: ABC transporter permease [Clostridia bacterium]|nr:ABC transporter permease [Clostridia bacterium]